MARFSCIAWESGQCELYFSLYIYKSGLCLTGKRFRCGSFPYLFGHFARSFFSGPPQCPHDQRLPVNLSRSFSQPTDRSIDRSYRIDHLFFLSLALSDFSIDYSVRGFRSLFSTLFFYPLFLSRRSSLYGTTGDLRETRSYFAIVFRFVLLLCFWLLSFPW